jgi:DnaJ family protein C protein 17
MASNTDLKTYATSTTDFYALLSLPPTFSQSELDRAWRRTALKYHPDKVGASDTVAAEKFHLAQIGYDILSDPTIRTLYDNARTAREQKERARKMFEGERKKMRDDLEERERAAGKRDVGGVVLGKRGREEEDLERMVRRLAEDGKRRRMEREEALRTELRQKEEAAQAQEMNGVGAKENTTANEAGTQKSSSSSVTELDRSVKVRWLSSSLEMDKASLEKLFSRFGKVEFVCILKTKRERIGNSREKQDVTPGVVVFTSVVGAHTAIEDYQKQTGLEWEAIQSVNWAANKAPDFLSSISSRNSSPAPATPTRKPKSRLNGTPAEAWSDRKDQDGSDRFQDRLGEQKSRDFDFLNGEISRPETPVSVKGVIDKENLRRVPSFASFSFGTPKGSQSPMAGVGSPSLEEITMIRLKEAEKRRLEAQIRREEEEAGVNG